MKRSFTLVTPSLDQAVFIERTVRSVLHQACGREVQLEYIVADGGSVDDSANRVRPLVEETSFARLVTRPDKGAADAIARALADARGDYIGWVNADDLLMPGTLASVARAFDRSGADVVYGEGWFIDSDDRITGVYPTIPHDPEFLRTFCYLSQPSTFVRRSAYDAIGGLDTDLEYCYDYELWLRLMQGGFEFSRVGNFCSATRLHPATKTARRSLAFTDEIIHVQERLFGNVPDAWRVYRIFRELDLERPRRPRLFNFGSALVSSNGIGHPGKPPWGWAGRVASAHVVAWFRSLPSRLARREVMG